MNLCVDDRRLLTSPVQFTCQVVDHHGQVDVMYICMYTSLVMHLARLTMD